MNTRSKLLDAAARRFSKDGFDRTSLSAIAGDLGVTKQTLLHHFGRKESLYGEVLEEISNRHLGALDAVITSTDTPAEQLEAIFLACYENALSNSQESQLLIRELLDNAARAEQAETWYLKPMLERLTALLQQTHAWEGKNRAEAFAGIYQILGAINYFAISQPTLAKMLGPTQMKAVSERFPSTLKALIRLTIHSPEDALVNL